MATVRWSRRLPKAPAIRNVVGPSTLHHVRLGRVQQRRWIQKPPARTRPWASMPRKEVDGRSDGRWVSAGNQEPDHVPGRNTQLATALAESDASDLVTDVRIPDNPDAVLPPDHPALAILGNSSLVIQRQLEMMNIMLGFEQANRYIIMDGQGQTLGYIAEQDHGMGSAMVRQLAKTHRSFTTHIFDLQEREVLRIHRPFAYINSRIRIYDPIPEGGYAEIAASTALQDTSARSGVDRNAVAQVSPLKLDEMRIIGEAQQQWAPLRRKYNLFSYRAVEPAQDNSKPQITSGEQSTYDTKALTEARVPDAAIEAGMVQFAHINEPFLSWDFTLRDEKQGTIGSVNRNFGGFARELFTDTGVYALRMDSAAQHSTLETATGQEVARYEKEATAMTLDQRAVMLATAVSIDFDYFSRHSHVGGGGGFMPIFWPMGGGAAEGGAAGAGAAGGAAAGGAGAVGAAEGAGALEGAAGTAVRGGAAGVGEGAIAGAGTMAGYEAMQRGVYGPRSGDDASPTANEPFNGSSAQKSEQQENVPGQDDVWGENEDPWGRGGPGGGEPPQTGGGEGGGGWMDAISDFFGE